MILHQLKSLLRRQDAMISALTKVIHGQPFPTSHPELLDSDELNVGITKAEFKHRRSLLSSLIISHQPSIMPFLAILPSSVVQFMSGIVPYPYRQDADFLYLTGIQQPGVACVLSEPTRGDPRLILFIEAPEPSKDRWDGRRIDKAGGIDFGADEVHYTTNMGSELHSMISSVVASSGSIFFDADRPNGHLHSTIMSILSQSSSIKPASNKGSGFKPSYRASHKTSHGLEIFPLRPLIHDLRLVKSPAEIKLMRKSCKLATSALGSCIQKHSMPGESSS